MRLALEEAEKAGKRAEVPIGATVVRKSGDDTFEVLSRASNRVERDNDASAHAELLALRRAAKAIGNWRLLNCTLYSTLEPCPLCLSATQAFRVESLVYGANDLRLGAVETYVRLLNYEHPFHNVTNVLGGVRQEQSADMLRGFFRQRRSKCK